jgi:ribonuclease Z
MVYRTLTYIAVSFLITSIATAETKVVILGSGNPVPDPERFGPSIAIVVDDRPYIVDAGTGVVRRAEAAYLLKSIPALDSRNIGHVFITHLHSDHTLGYADLILTPWVIGRSMPLLAYGPPGLEEMTDHLLKAFKQDLRIRTDDDTEFSKESIVVAKDVEPGVVYEDHRVKVTAFDVPHGTWESAYGYRFESEDRVVVVSGDTAPSEELVKQAQGCDVLLHEVYSEESLKERAAHAAPYHTTFHTSGIELGKLAARIKPKLLVLYHQLSFSTEEEIMTEIRENYDGPLEYGDDLDVF